MRGKKYILLTILWMAVIFFFSSQNGDTSGMNNMFIVDMLKRIGVDAAFMESININFWIRKAAHLTEYFILGMLLYKTYESYFFSGYGIMASLTGFLYAMTDEFHQHFVPGRGPSFRDVLIDTAGVLLGVALLLVLRFRKRRGSNISGPGIYQDKID